MPEAVLADVALTDVAAGAGPPVVLVHGLACGWRMWRSQIRALRPHYHVVAYDQRGHGRSAAPDDPAAYSQIILADDLAGLIRRLGLAPARIVGLSLGGGVAPELTIRHPGLVAALVLPDTRSGPHDPPAGRPRCEACAAGAPAAGLRRVPCPVPASPVFHTYL